jgi:hypothetical protein
VSESKAPENDMPGTPGGPIIHDQGVGRIVAMPKRAPSWSMTVERAREITAACVRTCFATTIGEEYVPLPTCSLLEMLQANEIVAADRGLDNGDGTRTILVNCAPRIIAVHYAFEQYGQDPSALLEALGIETNEVDHG